MNTEHSQSQGDETPDASEDVNNSPEILANIAQLIANGQYVLAFSSMDAEMQDICDQLAVGDYASGYPLEYFLFEADAETVTRNLGLLRTHNIVEAKTVAEMASDFLHEHEDEIRQLESRSLLNPLSDEERKLSRAISNHKAGITRNDQSVRYKLKDQGFYVFLRRHLGYDQV